MANIHANHRKRMRDRVESTGFQGFAPHEVLEYLLYQVIPVRDVNGLSHDLISRFGSLEGVLSADREALLSVRGVGPRTADYLHCLREVMDLYLSESTQTRKPITTLARALQYAVMDSSPDKPMLTTLFMTSSGHLTNRTSLPWHLPFDEAKQLVDLAIGYHTQSAVFILSSSDGNYQVTPQAWQDLTRLIEAFAAIEIRVVDFLLKTPAGSTSFRSNGMLKDSISCMNEPYTFPEWFNEDSPESLC